MNSFPYILFVRKTLFFGFWARPGARVDAPTHQKTAAGALLHAVLAARATPLKTSSRKGPPRAKCPPAPPALPQRRSAARGRKYAAELVHSNAHLSASDTAPRRRARVAPTTRDRPRVFTKAELAKYVDTSRGLKVAICGQVFDVTKGAEFYAKGAGYGFFAGRDASLAFATGNFKTNLTDNVGAPASFFERRVDGVPWRLDVRESITSTASR